MKKLLAPMLLLPALALANPYKDALTDAAEGLEDALSAAKRAGGGCYPAVKNDLNRGIDDIDDVRRGTTLRRFGEIQAFVNNVAATAQRSGCPQKVGDRIGRTVVALNTARAQLDDRDDRRERRRRDDDDDDDDKHGKHHPAEPPPPSQMAVGPLRVTYNQMVENEQGVRVDVTRVGFGPGRPPARFFLGARVRPLNGPPGPWEMTRAPFRTDVPLPPNQDLTTFWFKVRTLPGAQTAGGRFVVQVSAFDEQSKLELGTVEAPMEFAVAPPPPPVARDCGTPADAGCAMQRNGRFAMDRDTWLGFFGSVQANNSDLTKADMCKSVLAANYVTAKQLGLLLDLFNSDLVRFDVAKLAAPHTVNPQHALGLASKFRSGLIQNDFTKLMAEQR